MLGPTLACITTQKKMESSAPDQESRDSEDFEALCWAKWTSRPFVFWIDRPEIVHQLKTFTPAAARPASNWSNGKQKKKKTEVNCPQWQPPLGPIIVYNKIPMSHLKVRVTVWNSVVIGVRPQKKLIVNITPRSAQGGYEPTHLYTYSIWGFRGVVLSYTNRPSLVLSIPQFYQLENDHVHGWLC